MRVLQAIAFGLCLAAAACTANDSLSAWYGEYVYEAAAGQTAGGSPITLELTLTINKTGTSDSCLFQAAGFQTYKKIVCTLADKDSKLEVQFNNYAEGTLLKKYKVGEVLFLLEKKEGKDKKIRYVPQWYSYEPFRNSAGVETTGEFVRIKSFTPQTSPK